MILSALLLFILHFSWCITMQSDTGKEDSYESQMAKTKKMRDEYEKETGVTRKKNLKDIHHQMLDQVEALQELKREYDQLLQQHDDSNEATKE